MNEENVKVTKVDFQTKKVSVVGRARVAGQYRCFARNSLGSTGSPEEKGTFVQIFVSDLSSKIFFLTEWEAMINFVQ